MDTLSGGNSVKNICLLSEKGSILKGKNLLPMTANPFLLGVLHVQQSKQAAIKIVFLVNKWWENYQVYPVLLKFPWWYL